MMRHSLKIVPILVLVSCVCGWAQTPPIMPKIQTTPLPAPVELTPPASVPADVPNRPLTADEAAKIALHHQPNVTIAAAGVTSAQGRKKEAVSEELPTFGISSSYVNVRQGVIVNNSTTSTTGSPGGSATGFQSSATVRQLIFDFNHTRELARQSSSLEASARANLTRTQSDTVLQVKQAFYTYQQNGRLVTVNQSNVANSQGHLALAEARLKAGLGLPSDVVRAQTAVADAILNLNLAQTAASVSRVNLALFMGIDPRTPIVTADTSETPPSADDLNALIALGLKQRPEVLQARANLDAFGHALVAAKTTNAPSLGASVGWVGRGVNLSPDGDTLTVGVSLSFNPFDSGFTAGKIKEAKGNLQSVQAQMDATKLTVVSDVSQAYLNLKTAEQRVVTSDAEVANAKESLRLAQGRYQAGLGTFLDVLDAETALVTANTNGVNARSARDQARASLVHAIGAPVV